MKIDQDVKVEEKEEKKIITGTETIKESNLPKLVNN